MGYLAAYSNHVYAKTLSTMSTRLQGLLICVLLLVLPFLCWQSVKQLDISARQARVGAQSLSVAQARQLLSKSDELNATLQTHRTPYRKNDLYAEQASFPLFVDGYNDDWRYLRGQVYRFRNEEDAIELRLATRAKRLFLFISVKDNVVTYHQPPVFNRDLAEGETNDVQAILVNGDSIELQLLGADGHQQHIIFRSEAPGPVVGMIGPRSKGNLQVGRRMFRYKGFWSATQDGFQVEMSMPLPPSSTAFGLSFIDIDSPLDSRDQSLGTLTEGSKHLLGNLFSASSAVDQMLQPWVEQGSRIRLFDRQGRLLSDINALYEKSDEEFAYHPAMQGIFNAVLYRVFAAFVSRKEVAEQPFRLTSGLHLPYSDLTNIRENRSESNYYLTNERDTVIGTLATLGEKETDGFILFESNENLSSAYALNSTARAMCLLALVSLIVGMVLLVYTSVLRMRKSSFL